MIQKKINWASDIVSFCLGELRLSYEQYCTMTWAEFQLRLFAYKRMEKEDWTKIFELSTNIILSGFADGKDKKKRINDIRKAYLGYEKPQMSEEQRQAILKAQTEYNLKKNGSTRIIN